jgi:ABC-2 type transport system permease protein
MIDVGLFRDSLHSEWTKLRSVRSTYWSIIAAVVLAIGLGAAICAGQRHAYPQMSLHDKLTFDPTSVSQAGFFFAQLALGVFAIMTVSAEYSTGTIRTTLSAVPQRGYVLLAKCVLVSVLSFVVATASAFAAFFIGQLIFKGRHLNVPLSHPGTLRAVVGSGLYIAGLTLFSIGLASILRNTAGSITALAGIVFILPGVSQALPDSWQHDFARYLPANAGSSITNVITTGSDSLHPWTGFFVFLIWVAALLGVGWYLLRSRDV